MIYLPGNHDPFFRYFSGLNFGPVEVHHEMIHKMANGDKFLLMHGDRFDDTLYVGDLQHRIDESLYETIVTANRWLNISPGDR